MYTVQQGCPQRGSGTKFGSLAKFIWLLCVLLCVMHFGSGVGGGVKRVQRKYIRTILYCPYVVEIACFQLWFYRNSFSRAEQLNLHFNREADIGIPLYTMYQCTSILTHCAKCSSQYTSIRYSLNSLH